MKKLFRFIIIKLLNTKWGNKIFLVSIVLAPVILYFVIAICIMGFELVLKEIVYPIACTIICMVILGLGLYVSNRLWIDDDDY